MLGWFVANGVYQVARKPTELFFPISGQLHKTPEMTWRAYGPLFRRHATQVIAPDLLAAIAQVEASGNPVARTYWRWALVANPFAFYQPASSGVGLYQITDGTFEEAKAFCIHDHRVVRDGPWHDWESCWFSALYTRVIPSHAIELTSAYLDHHVARALAIHPAPSARLAAKQELAALIHLCGAGAGRAHARRGLQLPSGMRCGSHDVRRYLDKVAAQRTRFAALARRD